MAMFYRKSFTVIFFKCNVLKLSVLETLESLLDIYLKQDALDSHEQLILREHPTLCNIMQLQSIIILNIGICLALLTRTVSIVFKLQSCRYSLQQCVYVFINTIITFFLRTRVRPDPPPNVFLYFIWAVDLLGHFIDKSFNQRQL